METPIPNIETTPYTRSEIKTVVQELLRSGYIESAQKADVFASAMRLLSDINIALDPLDLRLHLDELRGLAVLRVAASAASNPDEEWTHPLVRRQRLTLEQSLLVAILRQCYLVQEQEIGIGVGAIKVPIDDLVIQLTVYWGDSGSDSKNEQRLLNLLDQLKPHGIVSEPDNNQEVTIRPLIVHLANPETLTALLLHFRQNAGNSEPVP